jgi:hypothetical protein
MTIESIAWQRTDDGEGDSVAVFPDFHLYMGLCDSDQLGTEFEENYIPGSRVLVFDASPLTAQGDPGGWFEIQLETPFWYDGSSNLIVELDWEGATGSFHTYRWNTPGVPRSLKAPTPDGPTGFLSSEMSELMLDGAFGLTGCTFGRIKVLLGSP